MIYSRRSLVLKIEHKFEGVTYTQCMHPFYPCKIWCKVSSYLHPLKLQKQKVPTHLSLSSLYHPTLPNTHSHRTSSTLLLPHQPSPLSYPLLFSLLHFTSQHHTLPLPLLCSPLVQNGSLQMKVEQLLPHEHHRRTLYGQGEGQVGPPEDRQVPGWITAARETKCFKSLLHASVKTGLLVVVHHPHQLTPNVHFKVSFSPQQGEREPGVLHRVLRTNA